MHDLHADRAVLHPLDDKLGYAPFAKMLATSVLKGCPADGLVVGIYGEWGLGKSTLLNFIAHEVEKDPDDTAVIVRFNPWWFSGKEDLIRRFFKEFEGAVLRKSARNKAIAEHVRKLGDAASSAPDWRVATVGRFVASAAKLSHPGDVASAKQSLSQDLAKDPFRVVVLVDDVDRLLPDDMLEVFRLIKAIGDLPNVIYVLAFDRGATTRALKDRFGEFGERYLDKIVQVQFDLPAPRPLALADLFYARLQPLIADAPAELRDPERVRQLYDKGLRAVLKTPRDIVRFINAVSITYPKVAREVDVPDFLGIEALRIHHREAYAFIRREVSHFVGVNAAMRAAADPDARTREERFVELWMQDLGEDRVFVEPLAKVLFPAIAKGSGWANREPEFRLAHRICTTAHFEKYFQYGLAHDELSREAFLALLELDSEVDVVAAVEGLVAAQSSWMRFREFLERLRDHLVGGGGISTPTHLLSALLRVGDRVIATAPRDVFFVDEYMLVLVAELLLQLLPQNVRLPTLMRALSNAGVSTVARIMGTVASQHGRLGEKEASPEAERVIANPNEVDTLQKYALERITDASQTSALWESPGLLRNLIAWRLLGGDKAVRAWVEQHATFDERLVRLLGLTAGVARVTSAGGTIQRPRIERQMLEAFFDVNELQTRLPFLVKKTDWSPAEREVLVAASVAIQRPEGEDRS